MRNSETLSEYWLGAGQSTASSAYDSLMSVLLLVWAAGMVFFIAYLLILLLRRREMGNGGQRLFRRFSWAPRYGALIFTIVILVYTFQSGVQGYLETVIAPANATNINIKATQWEWSVEYPDGTKPSDFVRLQGNDTVRAPIIPVPMNRPVRLVLTSDDSFHSLSIPGLRLKVGIFPDRVTNGTFTATERTPEGEAGHIVFCGSEWGASHTQMIAFIKVVTEEEFDRWILSGGRPAGPVSPIKRGKKLYMQKGCFACHTTTGATGVGPSWKGLFGSERRFADGTTANADEAYLRESIFSAGERVVEGYINQMPPYTGMISDDEAGAIIEYIKSLKDTP